VWLVQGIWCKGWSGYEWRLKTEDSADYGFRQPRWDGSLLAGRILLVWAEQGRGDTLQFIRYVPLLRRLGNRVIVQCQPRLKPLLSAILGKDDLVARGAPLPPFQVQVPLLSLPGLMRTNPLNVPANIPYLQVCTELTQLWQHELYVSGVRSPVSGVRALSSDTGLRTPDSGRILRIGIAWNGSDKYRYNRQRAVPLTFFRRLARIPGVQLFSLQKGPGKEQLQSVVCETPNNRHTTTESLAVVDLDDRLDETTAAFMDTAAVMNNLDLVITCDTAVPHLAGALGIPAWLALPLSPDWRWLLERDDSPWYPTMRLFRQTRYGCWDDVFDRIAEELQKATTAHDSRDG
jgi:hypothetical protein